MFCVLASQMSIIMYRTILEGLIESNWDITSFPITDKKNFIPNRMIIYIKKIHQNGDDNEGNEMEKSVCISMQSNQPVLIRGIFNVCVVYVYEPKAKNKKKVK